MQKQRIVVKIGSSSLTTPDGALHREKIAYYASELASLAKEGSSILLVTSGAVAAGFRLVGYKTRPKSIHEKQASAAVGQALLMQAYQESFAAYELRAAQILLTRSDFSERGRVRNAMMTIEELLNRGIIPVINENDTVSTDELQMKFGDNDTLSALAANLVKAEKLIIMTDMDGLYTADPRRDKSASRIGHVDRISDEIYELAGGAGSQLGTGGMRSKLKAARIAMRGGIPVFIGKAEEPGDLLQIIAGAGKGTYFDTSSQALSVKKQWVGFHSTPHGAVIIDDGAQSALLTGGKSLLPAGVRHTEGEFYPGDVVEVRNLQGQVIGRGIVNYSAVQLREASGLSSRDIRDKMDVARLEVIHRDEWMAAAP